MDPYKVLGISPSASDDEIKKAYRELSRKYHPDSYVDNPLAELAEEKFKEVQEAYKQVTRDRENGYTSRGQSTSGSSSSQSYGYGYGSQTQESSSEMQAVFNLLQRRSFREALNQLELVGNRNARWYYFSAIAHAGINNNIQAISHAKLANQMEPSNQEYASLVDRLQYGQQRYQQRGNTYGGGYGGGSSECGSGNLCCDLWCADSLCECMGGDLCACM